MSEAQMLMGVMLWMRGESIVRKAQDSPKVRAARSPQGCAGVQGRKVFCMGTVKDANDMEEFYRNRPESFRESLGQATDRLVMRCMREDA